MGFAAFDFVKPQFIAFDFVKPQFIAFDFVKPQFNLYQGQRRLRHHSQHRKE
jgi:hypothetical protein